MSARAIVPIDQPGDVLSPSQANGYLSCGFRWYGRYILHVPDPPAGARTLGSAVHDALLSNFEQKIETKQDLGAAGVTAIYTKAWDDRVAGRKLDRHGKPELATEFADDEDPAALQAQGLALTLKYLDEAAHWIEPAAIERAVNGTIAGVRVRGYIDVLDVDGRIIDIKTGSKKPSGISSDYRFQVATYAQLEPAASGDVLVTTLTKTKTPGMLDQAFTIEQSDIDATERLYPLVQRSIRARVYLPNRSHFMCSRKYCASWRACEAEFGGKVSE